MQIKHYLLLLINLSTIKCASTEDQNVAESINSCNLEESSKNDICSRHLNEELFHKVLEYDAKSTGRVGVASKSLLSLAKASREGAVWDMPELANVWKFWVTSTKDMTALEAEKAKIMALSDIKDETTFNEALSNLLFNENVLKELASPVLKYLIRRFNVRLNNGKVEDKYGAQRQNFLIFAVENRLYDVFFELSKGSGVWNDETLEEIIDNDIHDSFYFDCYNDYVYATRDYMLKKMASLQTDKFNIRMATPGGAGLTYSELSAWISVAFIEKLQKRITPLT